jgi:hypothetical protein
MLKMQRQGRQQRQVPAVTGHQTAIFRMKQPIRVQSRLYFNTVRMYLHLMIILYMDNHNHLYHNKTVL